MRCCVAGSSRREEIRGIHKTYSWSYPLLVGSLALLAGIWIGIRIGHWEFVDKKRDDYYMNLWTEGIGVLASAGITVLIIDQFNGMRIRREQRRRLALAVRSPSRDVAMSAIEELDFYGWLTGENGALKGADLMEAKLDEARLNGANLEQCILDHAELHSAKLIGASLRDAILTFAKLHNAKLEKAQMQSAKCHGAELLDARLSNACLEDADLSYACLEGASLQRARMKGADLHRAKLKRAFLWDADFYDADLTMSELREAEYHNKASWEKAKLRYVDLRGVDFSDANMKGADFECANLEGVDFWGTNLQGINLRGALLRDAKFSISDGFRNAYSGDTSPNFEDLSDDEIAHKTNWIGATLPDGTEFTEDMDYKEILRFTSPFDPQFGATLATIEAYRNRP